jgi:hypothetical protein
LPSQNLPQSSFPSTSLPSFIESPQQNLLSTTTAPSPSELFVQQHPLRLTDTLSESSTVPNTNTLNFTTDQQKDINKKWWPCERHLQKDFLPDCTQCANCK